MEKTLQDVEKLRRALVSSTFGNPLDSVEHRHGEIIVTFRAVPKQTTGAIVMCVEGWAYSIGSSSTASTSTFEAVAQTYIRAMAFVKAAGLTAKGA